MFPGQANEAQPGDVGDAALVDDAAIANHARDVVSPTGRTVTLHSASIVQIKNGLIASEHVYLDQSEMMSQPGLDGS